MFYYKNIRYQRLFGTITIFTISKIKIQIFRAKPICSWSSGSIILEHGQILFVRLCRFFTFDIISNQTWWKEILNSRVGPDVMDLKHAVDQIFNPFFRNSHSPSDLDHRPIACRSDGQIQIQHKLSLFNSAKVLSFPNLIFGDFSTISLNFMNW